MSVNDLINNAPDARDLNDSELQDYSTFVYNEYIKTQRELFRRGL